MATHSLPISRIQTLTRWKSLLLPLVMIVQVITHWFWLPISAHSGQVAIPWMMNQGRTMFGDLLEQHAPGSSVIAALAERILPFEPIVTDKLLNLLLILALSWLIYHLANRLGGSAAAMAALLFWFWWEPVYGNILFYFDAIVGFMVLLAVTLWLGLEKGAFMPFLVGLLMGAATLAKQHAWAAVVLFALWILITPPPNPLPKHGEGEKNPQRRLAKLALYAAGALIFPALTVGIAAAQGNLERYWYWNWGFNLSGLMASNPLTGDFVRKVLLTNVLAPAFWLLAVQLPAAQRRMTILVGLMWAACSLTIMPRPGESHVMGLLPLLAVMSGVTMAEILKSLIVPPQDERVAGTPVISVIDPHPPAPSPSGGRGVLPLALSEAARERGWGEGFRVAAILARLKHLRPAELALAGIGVIVLAAWFWTGAAAYAPGPLGRAGIPAYDEFKPLAARLQALKQPGDTLFVLPETDSTPQIHVMSEMLTPGLWIKGWYWYLLAPGIGDQLLAEWQANPPTWVVVFPDLLSSGQPSIEPLVTFTDQHYTQVDEVDNVVFHGNALIYHLK